MLKPKGIVERFYIGKPVLDYQLDSVLYDKSIYAVSDLWTPISVALQAAELFEINSKTRLLDIGSGCGKFCITAALARGGSYVGIELRQDLVRASQEAAKAVKLDHVYFLEGDMSELDWSNFNALYFFNPFDEFRKTNPLMPNTMNFSGHKIFERYVEITKAKLMLTPSGTKVVTYHGFGGEMPDGFQCHHKIPAGTDFLELWVKS